jgi:hypothetical protein
MVRLPFLPAPLPPASGGEWRSPVTSTALRPEPSGRRSLAALLRDDVVEDVGHAQWVFTVPKMLRVYFLHHRELLGALSLAAYETVKELMAAAAVEEKGFRPGLTRRDPAYPRSSTKAREGVSPSPARPAACGQTRLRSAPPGCRALGHSAGRRDSAPPSTPKRKFLLKLDCGDVAVEALCDTLRARLSAPPQVRASSPSPWSSRQGSCHARSVLASAKHSHPSKPTNLRVTNVGRG